jgi:hypothetical protein
MTDLRQRIALRDRFLDTLITAACQRDRRQSTVDGPDGPEPEWAGYERDEMKNAVDCKLAARGLPPATQAEIVSIERSAAGHSDYAAKYALRCAFLVEQREAATTATRTRHGRPARNSLSPWCSMTGTRSPPRNTPRRKQQRG